MGGDVVITIESLDDMPLAELQPLIDESQAEGFTFVERLVANYQDGSNRFAGPGEVLYGVYARSRLVAVGGLNRDPYLSAGKTGRVRHVYVLAAWRRRGIGRKLMEQIIRRANDYFEMLTLRTLSSDADQFYRSLGFRTDSPPEHSSHFLPLKRG